MDILKLGLKDLTSTAKFAIEDIAYFEFGIEGLL